MSNVTCFTLFTTEDVRAIWVHIAQYSLSGKHELNISFKIPCFDLVFHSVLS